MGLHMLQTQLKNPNNAPAAVHFIPNEVLEARIFFISSGDKAIIVSFKLLAEPEKRFSASMRVWVCFISIGLWVVDDLFWVVHEQI